MRLIAPSVLVALVWVAYGCSDPEAAYQAELAACGDTAGAVCGAEQVPMLTRRAKAEELAKMGGHATHDDINGTSRDDPKALQEVKESFVAYYNMPFGADGERDAWIRFMRAVDNADRLRAPEGTVVREEALADKALLDEVSRNQAELERRIAEETARRSVSGQ